MASHGGMKNKTPHLLALVLTYLQEKGDYPPDATFTPALCNRLDVNTSGLVICGKNYQAIRAVNALFASSGCIDKQYLGIVEGELTGTATLEGHYQKDTKTNTVRITPSSQGVKPTPKSSTPRHCEEQSDEAIQEICKTSHGFTYIGNNGLSPGDSASKRVITAYTSISVSGGRTLLSINPITGRSHQIRAHLASIGHPLTGDKKYGGKPVRLAPGQLLHCNQLRLTEPFMDYPINTTWTAEPPAYFMKLMQV